MIRHLLRTSGDAALDHCQALEQIVLADQLGFDQVCEVEHHCPEGYCHSSTPEVMTKNIFWATAS